MNGISTSCFSSWILICTPWFGRICWGISIGGISSTRLLRLCIICILPNWSIGILSLLMSWLIRIVSPRYVILGWYDRFRIRRRNPCPYSLTTLPPGGTEHHRYFLGQRNTRKLRMCGVLAVWSGRWSEENLCSLDILPWIRLREWCSGQVLQLWPTWSHWRQISVRRWWTSWQR